MSSPSFQRDGVSIFQGDALAVLRSMPEDSVHCCATSPPYWGLRDYGNKPTVWGGDAACEHEWVIGRGATRDRQHLKELGERLGCGGGNKHSESSDKYIASAGSTCQKCSAWLGCYGLEPTPEMFVEHTVEIFREVKRVLHPDGTLWLNFGDSYNNAGSRKNGEGLDGNRRGGAVDSLNHNHRDTRWTLISSGIKHKDLCMIPWRVYIALQADGWWLRSIICWAKKSPMPESVTDRPTSSWEPIALLTKAAKYFYDAEAVKEEQEQSTFERYGNGKAPRKTTSKAIAANAVEVLANASFKDCTPDALLPYGRNMRNVWHLGPEPYPDAHFATFPTEIPRRCIKAGTSEHGCCPKCLSPYRRIIDKQAVKRERPNEYTKRTGQDGTGNSCANTVAGVASRTVGWEATCKCEAGQPIPCRVLDPFFGSGTTGEVAQELGCECWGIELNPEYIELAKKRFKQRTFLVGA